MPPRRRDQHTDGSRGPCLPSKVLVIQDPNRPPIRPDFFHPNARVIDDLDHFVCYSFRPKLAGECVLVAKLLVACDPAGNGGPAGHPGFATDGAKAFALGKPGAESKWRPESYNPRAGRAWVGHQSCRLTFPPLVLCSSI